MNYPGLVLAYHGCDRRVGERIISGKEHVRVSSNDYDWLGTGAYFWENNPQRALDWAHFLRDHPEYAVAPIHAPFVIGAIIQPGRALDLTETVCVRILRDAYTDFAQTMIESGIELPSNERGHPGDSDFVKRKLDCAVINFLHLANAEYNRPQYDSVRAPFFEGGSLYPGAGFSAKTHIQWCVRNPKRSIRGYFLPLPGWDE